MNNNVIWQLIISIILFWPCSRGDPHKAVNSANFVDNEFLEDAQSNVKVPLDSPTKPSVATASRSSNQSIEMQIASKNEAVTSLQSSEVPQVAELRQTDSNRSIQPPPLSMEDTSPTEAPEDDPEFRLAPRQEIIKVYRNQEKTLRNVHTEVLPQILWNTSSKHSIVWHYHNKKLRSYPPHVMKRSASLPNDAPKTLEGLSIRVNDIIKGNGTDDNGGFTTTEVSHPSTPSPEDEEFVPGMTKLRFITVASTALMLGLFVALITIYYIRRRRLRRAMDPERQSLIPFRMSTGIYYNQTGLCF